MTASKIHWPLRTEASLEVFLLGLVDFDAALFLQERFLHEISQRDDNSGVVLVCEHPALVTVGREGSQSHILCEPEELVARQIPVRRLNRGGGCLMHAPGQLAVYPIIPLNRRGVGLADYRERLEQAVMDMCTEFRVPTWRQEEAGVWCRCGQLAHLGAAVRSGISYHGLFINVSPRLDALRLVKSNPLGGRVTSLSAQRLKPTAMPATRESVIRHLAAQLNYERYHLYTGHPLLRRTKRVVAYA